MSSRTRSDAAFFSGVSLPIMSVFTGPAAGNIDIIVSDWNLTRASESSGWNTPHAPSHGSERSSIFKPRSSRPSTYVCIQSLRDEMSESKSPSKSPASSVNSPSDISSARLALKSSSPSPSSMRRIGTPSILSSTDSGSSISISISSGSSISAASSIPMGAW